MSVAVTLLRSTIAAALENAGVWSVYSYPPASPTANSVIVQPDDPYLEPTNQNFNTVDPTANFIITMNCSYVRQSRKPARYRRFYGAGI
jgi:hypothetical protein